MHDLLLEHQQQLRPVDLVRYAAELGLDVDRFHDDLRRHVGAAQIAEDVDSAGSSGVAGTPTLFVNGRRQYGAYDIDTLTGSQDGKGSGEARRARPPPGRSTSSRLTPPARVLQVPCQQLKSGLDRVLAVRYMNPLNLSTKARAVSATSRQPLSIVRA